MRKICPWAPPAAALLSGNTERQKVTIMLEELLALGVTGAEYDAWLIRIGEGDQFSSGFVEVNPNSKIPALRDHSTTRQRASLNPAISCSIWQKIRSLPAERSGGTHRDPELAVLAAGPRRSSAAVLATSTTMLR
jgi:hypothetical protein